MSADYAITIIDPATAILRARAYSDVVIKLQQDNILRKGHDYGTIPGTSKKDKNGKEIERNVLLKPGAEKLCSTFGFAPVFKMANKVEDWEKPFFHYQYVCKLIDLNGRLVATALGSCNSMESKYRWRWAFASELAGLGLSASDFTPDRVQERDGRNGKYKVYRVDNSDIYSQVNTIDKMAQKRALIAAVLIGANASEYFTQDVEDLPYFGMADVVDAEYQDVTEPPKNTIILDNPRPSAPAVSGNNALKVDTDTARQHLGTPKGQRVGGDNKIIDMPQSWYTGDAQVKFDDWLTGRRLQAGDELILTGRKVWEFADGRAACEAIDNASANFFTAIESVGLISHVDVRSLLKVRDYSAHMNFDALVEAVLKAHSEQKATPPAQPTGRPAYNYAAVWTVAKDEDFDFSSEPHFKNWLKQKRADGTVTDATTTNELIELARKHVRTPRGKAADTEAQKPWYADALAEDPRKAHTATFHSIKYLKSADRWIFIGGVNNEREISEFGDGFWTLANTLSGGWIDFLRGVEQSGLDFVHPFKGAVLPDLEIKWHFNKDRLPAAKILIPLDDSNIKF